MDKAVAEFGAGIGLRGLAFGPDGLAALELKGLGKLFLERNGEELLVYLAAPLLPYDWGPLKRALELVHIDRAPARPCAAAYRDDQLVLLIRFDRREVDGPALENGVRFLVETMRRTGLYG